MANTTLYNDESIELILNGNLEHVTHACSKLKTEITPYVPCALFYELPSNICTMNERKKEKMVQSKEWMYHI